MNVLYILDTYKPIINGVAVSIERQARALDRLGHRVSIVAPGEGWKDYEEFDNGIKIFRTRGLKLVQGHRLALPSVKEAQFVLGKFRPDLMVVVLPFPLSKMMLTEARRQGIVTVAISGIVPEWLLYNIPALTPVWAPIRSRFWRYIVDHYNECDQVIGVTPTAVRFLQENGLKRPAAAISNGVNLAQFSPKARNEKMAASMHLPNKPTVLYTGRIDKDKCLDVLINAIPVVRETVDAHFILGGDGIDKHRMVSLVNKLKVEKDVTFPGFLKNEDYPAIYSLADVFAISSPTELQSIVTLEAAASGLPVVAVNAGALPELVKDGVNGFLFEQGNSRQMADSIVKLLINKDLRTKMGAQSRRIAEQHDFNAAIKQYERLYQTMLHKELAA